MKRILPVFVLAAALSACAGRPARPVQTEQHGDKIKSCALIESDLGYSSGQISALEPESSKLAYNLGVGVAGFFFPPIWFAFDVRNADATELAAWQQRKAYLTKLHTDKSCDAVAQAQLDAAKAIIAK